ncbi:MAG: DUF1330 domain-containing protein [Pseudomonadota bacterium]
MHINPTSESFAAFRALPQDTPLHMLNLVRFRDWAAYEDRRKVTGAEAYAEYGRLSAPVLTRLGGSILWRGTFENTTIGPADEHWDAIFIAHYPSAAAFLEMLRDPAYQEAVTHRTAAVADSRLIRCGEAGSGAGFAG